MPPRHDIPEINRRLGARVDELVRRFYPAAKPDGPSYWRLGSIAGEAGQSLWIYRRGHKSGEWHDSAAGQGGDALSLVQHGMGGDFKAALAWAADWTGLRALDSETPEQRAAREARWRAEEAKRVAREAQAAANKRQAAKALFLSGSPLTPASPGWRYLEGRAIDLARLPYPVDCLRFLADCRSAPTQAHPHGERRPALLACVVDAAGLLTVHRHFICRLNGGDWVKASDSRVPEAARMEGKSAKQAYTSFGGGIIPVWRGAGHVTWRAKNCAPAMIATEGLEDALSWALARPELRAGASVSLGNFGRMWLPAGVDRVLWHRHRGDGEEAVRAYQTQAEAMRARGVAVDEIWAPDGRKDVNEWLQQQAGVR